MRIIHLLASPVFSGPAENISQLALSQRALGHQVVVAVDRKRRSVSSEELAAARFGALALLDAGGLELSIKSTPLGVLRDIRALKARSENVVHCHFSHDHWLARLARRPGSVLIRSFHAPRSLRITAPYADAFTVPDGLEVPFRKRPTHVLPALVDASFRPAANKALLRGALGLNGTPLIGMISTFQASRRHALGLEAFAKVRAERKEARLVLVGDGVLLPAIRERVRATQLADSVIFPGYRSGPEFVSLLQALDEVWILGLGNDYSARAAAQARACGVRVVSVAEGALASFADVVTAPNAAAISSASLGDIRRELTPLRNEDVARSILSLYAEAGARE